MPDNGEGQGQEDHLESAPEEPQASGEERVISRDALPEELRDLPEDQIGTATQALVRTLRSRNQEVEQLRGMVQYGGEGNNRYAEPEEEEEELPELSDDELRDMMLENPEEALDYYAKKKGFDKRLREIERMAEEGVQSSAFTRARQDLPEFDQYEEQVEEILQTGGAAATYANIRGAYLMARGAKDLDRSARAKAQRVTSEKPSPPEEEEKEVELSPGEEKARQALGLSKEDYLRGKEGPVEVTPPGIED